MGLVGSKDESGKVVLGALPPGFLDYRGRDLRDKLDMCLAANMWFFTIGGILITIPICVKYRTERPLFAAAISCPVMDMMYGTIRCDKEKEEFRRHFQQLQATWSEAARRHVDPSEPAVVEPGQQQRTGSQQQGGQPGQQQRPGGVR